MSNFTFLSHEMLVLAEARQWLNLLPFLRFVWLMRTATQSFKVCAAHPNAFYVNAQLFWLALKLYIIPWSSCDEISDIKKDSQTLAKLLCPCLLILNAMVLFRWLKYLFFPMVRLHRKNSVPSSKSDFYGNFCAKSWFCSLGCSLMESLKISQACIAAFSVLLLLLLVVVVVVVEL